MLDYYERQHPVYKSQTLKPHVSLKHYTTIEPNSEVHMWRLPVQEN